MKLAALASILAVFSQVDFASAASFDCAKAGTSIEKLICSDNQLSELDSQLAETYALARTQSSNSDQIKSEQRDWLKNVRNRCADIDCFRSAYTARLSALASHAPSTPEIQTPTVASDSDVKHDAMPDLQTVVAAEHQPADIATNNTAQIPRAQNHNATAPQTGVSGTKTKPEKDKGSAWLGAIFLVGIWYWYKKRKENKKKENSTASSVLPEPTISPSKSEVIPPPPSREDEVKQRYQQMLNEQLFEAVVSRKYDKIGGLVAKGADANAASQITPYTTPLGQAARVGDIAAVKILINLGVDVNMTSHRIDDPRLTPLHYAAKVGNIETVVALLGRGADVNARTARGEDALQIAEQEGHKSVANLLIEFMATRKLPNIDELKIDNEQVDRSQEPADSEVSRIELVTKPQGPESNSKTDQTPLAEQDENGGSMRITDVIVEWLKEKGWEERPELDEENQSSSTVFSYNISDDLSVTCFLDAAEKAGFIKLTMYFLDPKIPKAKLDEVIKYTNEVNVRNVVGQLAVMEDKTLRWYSGIDVEGTAIETRLIENLLDAGLSTMKRRLPQFMAVCFAGKTAEEALEIEAE